jgi:hypothetical protein
MTRALPSRGVVAAALVIALAVSGCATIPSGPSVMVLPGSTKNFEQFQMDDGLCRQWAAQQTGTTNDQATAGSTVQGAAIGTLIGAAAGAALGAAAGNPALGAAAGAGAGLLGGSAVGASRGDAGPLRSGVRAVHVRQGQPGAGGPRLASATADVFASATPAASAAGCHDRSPGHASASARSTAASAAVSIIGGLDRRGTPRLIASRPTAERPGRLPLVLACRHGIG